MIYYFIALLTVLYQVEERHANPTLSSFEQYVFVFAFKKCCNNFHPSWLIYGSHKPLLCKAFCKLLKLFFVYLCLSRETFGNDSNIPIVYNLVVSFRKFIHFPPRINFLLIKHFILSSQGKVAVWHKHYLSILTFVQKVQN